MKNNRHYTNLFASADELLVWQKQLVEGKYNTYQDKACDILGLIYEQIKAQIENSLPAIDGSILARDQFIIFDMKKYLSKISHSEEVFKMVFDMLVNLGFYVENVSNEGERFTIEIHWGHVQKHYFPKRK